MGMRTSQRQRRPEVVVITGASAGIGREVARAFAKRGAAIGLLARGIDGLMATQREVEEYGGRALAIPTDVAKADQVEAAAQSVEAEFGPIDIWVNNAMTSVFAPVLDITSDEFRRVTEVTYLGQVYGAQSALKRMRARDRGTIVFVGSALAYRGIPLQSAYCAAKHAIQGFFDSLRCELLHDHSKVVITMVQLAGFNTTQFGWVKCKLPNEPKPVGRIYQPEVAAKAIVLAAHRRRREWYVGWPCVEAITANKLAPGLLDRYLAQVAVSGQQGSALIAHDRRDALWEPIPGDHGAHGPFHAEAKRSSFQYWLSVHRLACAASVLMALGILALGVWER
jgi:NAD(P)-dependent dehydrogenase (short-subunit alcohol dehydrogenase family)